MIKVRVFDKIIRELCEEMDIELVPMCYDWVYMLKKENKVRYFFGYIPEINSATSNSIFKDKYATSSILKELNIPHVEHQMFMRPKNINDILVYANKYNCNVVCKPNEGTSGNFVRRVTDENQLLEVIDYLFKKVDTVAISPYFDIKNEYRVIVFDNNVELIYKKIRKNNEEWRHNLSKGSIPDTNISVNLRKTLSNIALDAINRTNSRIASVDIVCSNKKYYILEINGGIMMESFSSYSNHNYEIAKDIYRKIIINMFK